MGYLGIILFAASAVLLITLIGVRWREDKTTTPVVIEQPVSPAPTPAKPVEPTKP